MSDLSPTRSHLFGLDFVDAASVEDIAAELLAYTPVHLDPDGLTDPVLITPNVDQLVKRNRHADPVALTLAGRARWVLADGQPIVWASRLLGTPLQARLAGSSLTAILWPRLVESERRALVIATSDEIAERVRAENCMAQAIVAPMLDARRRVEFESFIDTCVEAATSSGAEYVFVTLGYPKQDNIIAEMLHRWPRHRAVPVFLAIGASFDMYYGVVRRAPGWMQRTGLEWLFRFGQEPRRLFRRYFIDGLWFGPMVLSELRRSCARSVPPGARVFHEHLVCPSCTGDRWLAFYDKSPYRYVRCQACGLVRLSPFPTAGEAAELYSDEYFKGGAHGGYPDYEGDASLHMRNARMRVGNLPRPARESQLVDVGCAYGFTLLAARTAGWEPVGVEVNDFARERVASHGISAAVSIEALTVSPGTVGAVTYFQSLEHLPDPFESLCAARRLLADHGRVVIETWDRSSLVARLLGRHWQQVTPPSVLWLFTRDDVKSLLERAGFTDVRVRRSRKWVSAELVVGQMAERGNRLGGVLRTSFGSALKHIAAPYALGDLITVTARSADNAPALTVLGQHSSNGDST